MSETLSTEIDLIAVLEKYPNTTVVESREGDEFLVREYSSEDPYKRGDAKLVSVQLTREDLSHPLYPMISYEVSDGQMLRIELQEEGVKISGVNYDDIAGLMELTLCGLEIMEVFKQLTPEERISFAGKYNPRVYDWRHQSEGQSTYDCLPMAIKALKRVLSK